VGFPKGMNNLFKDKPGSAQAALFAITGLTLLPEFITRTQEAQLLKIIGEQTWSTDLKRRVQHYGYRYDYKARTVSEDNYLGTLPAWIDFAITRMSNLDIFSKSVDQAIINEYLPGQGIAPHIDCVPCFSGTIASLSLGSTCQMAFTQVETDDKAILTLRPRSLLILRDDARYKWRHAIPARKSDLIDGVRTPRDRRVSVTFRQVNRSL